MTMNDSNQEPDRFLLIQKIWKDEGTLEEQEAWLLELQDSDPHFWQSDAMLYLEEAVRVRRRVQRLRDQLGTPPGTPLTREQLIALVEGIDYSNVNSPDEIEEMDARSVLFATSVPHPDATSLVNHVWGEKDKSAEEVVDAALSWTVPDLFCLPGSIDPDWARSSAPEAEVQ